MNEDPHRAGGHRAGPEDDGLDPPPGVQANAALYPMTRPETLSPATAPEGETGSEPRTTFHRHSTDYESTAEP